MVALPISLFLRLNKLSLGKTVLRAMMTGTGVVGFHIAANFMLPDYFAFTNLTEYLASGAADTGGTSSLALWVVMILPSMVGGLGFVMVPIAAKILPQLIKGRLKIKVGRGSPEAGGSQEASGGVIRTSVAGMVVAADQAIAAASSAPAQDVQTTTAAAAPPMQAGPSPEELTAMVEQAVGKKVEEATADLKGLKVEFTTFQSEITKIKQDVQNLTASLEMSLTDLKAFQAEMTNPLNFMRKYFDALDIKNLSDPTQVLPQIEIKAPAGTELAPIAKSEEQRPAEQQKISVYSHENDDKIINNGEKNQSGQGNDVPAQSDEPSPSTLKDAFERLVAGGEEQCEKEGEEEKMTVEAGGRQDSNGARGKVSLGKLMSMVSVLDKIVQDIGSDNIETLMEHYRQFGLNTEVEMAIYNIVSMMKDFNMGPDDIVVKLYKLGQVMGIKDPQADLEYAKIMARIKSRSKSPPGSRPDTNAGPGNGNATYRKDNASTGGVLYGKRRHL